MVGPLARILALTAVLLVGFAALPAGVPRPDALVLLLAPTALRGGSGAAAAYGFLAGLLLGLVGPGTPGLFAGVYGLVGAILGSWKDEGGGDGLFMTVVMVSVGTVLAGLALAGSSALAGLGPPVPVLKLWMPRTLVLNVLLAWPFAALFRAVAGERAFRRPGLEL